MGSSGWGERAWVNLLRVAPLRAFTRMVRAIVGLPVPRAMRRALLGFAARRLGMDLSEAEQPLESYRSLAELFVRKLRAGARPIDAAADAIVSPVDGSFVGCGIVAEGRMLQAKGIDYTLAQLVGDPALAARFDGGSYATIYLRPKDYHRIHAPVAGEVVATRRIPGRLFPVQPAFVRHRRGLFAGNERLVVELAADAGATLVIAVGAMGVGTVTTTFGTAKWGADAGYQRYAPRPRLERGQELGAFNLGSTVILVFEPGRSELDSCGAAHELKMGVAIGRWRQRAGTRSDSPQPAEGGSGQARSA